MNLNKALAFLSLLILPALVACGGGGGGSSSVPSTNSGTTTTGGGSTATSAPTPTPTPTLSATGTVKDLGTHRYSGDSGTDGVAIAGATVVIGPTLINGATPPPTLPTGDVSTTTGATGTYTANGYSGTGTTYVMVFPATGDTHVSLHGLAKVASGSVRTLYLYNPTSVELTELSQLNTDRTTNSVAAIIPDEIAFESARASADFKAANGYYQHCIPATNCFVVTGISTTPPASYAPQYVSPDDLYNSLNGAVVTGTSSNQIENFTFAGTGYTWPQGDAFFMNEKTNLGSQTCATYTGSATVGHYCAIIATTVKWVGLGSNTNGAPTTGFTNGGTLVSPVTVYTQHLLSPSGGV